MITDEDFEKLIGKYKSIEEFRLMLNTTITHRIPYISFGYICGPMLIKMTAPLFLNNNYK